MKKEKILTNFFESYSENVDNADNSAFWKLSDTIIEAIIQKHIDTLYTGKLFTIFDAGCGTGKRIKKIIEKNSNKNLHFIAYDLFDSMLNKAKQKLAGFKNIEFIKGDLQHIQGVQPNSIDLCISIYSPISFVDNPSLVIGEIKNVLKQNGEALIMGHSFHNAIDSKINNYFADPLELKEMKDKKIVKWNDSLPNLNTYSIEIFEELGLKNQLSCLGGYGIPIYVRPQAEDWDSKNLKKSKISLMLESQQDFFNRIFELEMEYNADKSLINRGMNILAFFKKNE